MSGSDGSPGLDGVETGSVAVGGFEVGTADVGTAEVGIAGLGIVDLGIGEVGTADVGIAEVDTDTFAGTLGADTFAGRLGVAAEGVATGTGGEGTGTAGLGSDASITPATFGGIPLATCEVGVVVGFAGGSIVVGVVVGFAGGSIVVGVVVGFAGGSIVGVVVGSAGGTAVGFEVVVEVEVGDGFEVGVGAGLDETRHLLSTSALTSVITPCAAVTAPAMSGTPVRSLTRPNRSASTLATLATHASDGGADVVDTFGRQPAFCRAVTSPSAFVMSLVASSIRGGFAVRSEPMPGSRAANRFASSEHCAFCVGVAAEAGACGAPGCPPLVDRASAGAATDAATATDRAAAPTARLIFTVRTAPRLRSHPTAAPGRPATTAIDQDANKK